MTSAGLASAEARSIRPAVARRLRRPV